MVDFQAMTKTEAEAFLQRWLGEGPGRLAWLRETVASSGGPAHLDGTGTSLGPLWAWARTHFAWRNPDQPVDQGRLPAWFHHPSGVGYNRFDDHTLWLIDAIARYWADVLITAGAPGLRWGVGHSRIKGYADQNQPVLLGLPDPLNPINTTAVLAARSLKGTIGDDGLSTAHQNRLSDLEGAADGP